MLSHKELLESAVAAAERDYQVASSEDVRLCGEVKTVKDAIELIQIRLDAACVAVARADKKAEDPSALEVQRNQYSHRLLGLEQLRAAALPAQQEAGAKLTAAQNALNAELDREELARLEVAVKDANTKQNAAQSALKEAEHLARSAGHALYLFRKKLERDERHAALVALGRA